VPCQFGTNVCIFRLLLEMLQNDQHDIPNTLAISKTAILPFSSSWHSTLFNFSLADGWPNVQQMSHHI